MRTCDCTVKARIGRLGSESDYVVNVKLRYVKDCNVWIGDRGNEAGSCRINIVLVNEYINGLQVWFVTQWSLVGVKTKCTAIRMLQLILI
jgi:hypothetical protein